GVLPYVRQRLDQLRGLPPGPAGRRSRRPGLDDHVIGREDAPVGPGAELDERLELELDALGAVGLAAFADERPDESLRGSVETRRQHGDALVYRAHDTRL